MAQDYSTDERLARLEQVFAAIANAWTSHPASDQGAPDPTRPGGVIASSGAKQLLGSTLVDKLTAFSYGLTETERQQLAILMEAALRAAPKNPAQFENANQASGVAFLADLDRKISQGDVSAFASPGGEQRATWTLTTTVTVAASHPWITCEKQN